MTIKKINTQADILNKEGLNLLGLKLVLLNNCNNPLVYNNLIANLDKSTID